MTDAEKLDRAEAEMRHLAECCRAMTDAAADGHPSREISELQRRTYTSCAEIVRDFSKRGRE